MDYSNYQDQNKKSIQQPSDDFEKEASEGWQEVGMDKWDAIHQKLDHLMDGEIRSSETPIKPLQSTTRKKFPFSISIAAMILVIMGLSIHFIFNQPENVSLFDQYYRPLDAPEDNFRSGENVQTVDERAKSASDAYDDLEYKKSIALYSELLKEYPDNSKYTLFLGLSYINDGKFDQAITLFNTHVDKNTPYDEDIEWYLALAHLRKGEIQTSKSMLLRISEDDKNYYSNTAKELVSKLATLK